MRKLLKTAAIALGSLLVLLVLATAVLALLAVPIGWLLFYCPATCRADAGIFNLANSLNLLLGLLAALALGLQLRRSPQAALEGGR